MRWYCCSCRHCLNKVWHCDRNKEGIVWHLLRAIKYLAKANWPMTEMGGGHGALSVIADVEVLAAVEDAHLDSDLHEDSEAAVTNKKFKWNPKNGKSQCADNTDTVGKIFRWHLNSKLIQIEAEQLLNNRFFPLWRKSSLCATILFIWVVLAWGHCLYCEIHHFQWWLTVKPAVTLIISTVAWIPFWWSWWYFPHSYSEHTVPQGYYNNSC